MKTIALKLNNLKSHANIVNNDNLQGRVLNSLLAAMGLLALCYVFFLGNMVWNIVERKALEVRSRTLASEVGALELQYLSMSNKVDLPLSYSLGFKETRAVFSTRRSLGSFGSLNSPASSRAVKVKNEI